MNVEDLMELFDIESAEDFAYFEQFSGIIEHTEEIDSDLFYDLISMASTHALVEMTDNYFLDIMQGIPDDNMELYTTMSSIKEMMVLLAKASHSPREKALYIEELENFRKWFIFSKNIKCLNEETKEISYTTVHEALVLYRMEKLSGEKYLYDFSDALPYEADEYALTVAEDLRSTSDVEDTFSESEDFGHSDSYEYDDNYVEDGFADHNCNCGHHHIHNHEIDQDSSYEDDEIDPWTEGLVDRLNPVIDGVDYEKER